MLGIIGGSGLYDIPELEVLERREIETPFGAPSDAVLFGRIGDTELAFLARVTGRSADLAGNPHEDSRAAFRGVAGPRIVGDAR